MKNWKSLVSTLANIQALFTVWIMGDETGTRSNFNSVRFYELCLKFTTYDINEVFLLRMRVWCPNIKFW